MEVALNALEDFLYHSLMLNYENKSISSLKSEWFFCTVKRSLIVHWKNLGKSSMLKNYLLVDVKDNQFLFLVMKKPYLLEKVDKNLSLHKIKVLLSKNILTLTEYLAKFEYKVLKYYIFIDFSSLNEHFSKMRQRLDMKSIWKNYYLLNLKNDMETQEYFEKTGSFIKNEINLTSSITINKHNKSSCSIETVPEQLKNVENLFDFDMEQKKNNFKQSKSNIEILENSTSS